jgi:prevent-host-death family protein
MRYSSQIKPISYLKERTAAVVKEITESRTPMIITQNGEATFVVQDIHSFEQMQQSMALLKILALGQREIERGQFTDADGFFAELDKEVDG